MDCRCPQCRRRWPMGGAAWPLACACGHVMDSPTECGRGSGGPSIAEKLSTWKTALARWHAHGRPALTQDEIDARFAACQSCPSNALVDGHCSACGCPANRQPVSRSLVSIDALLPGNKLALATEACPKGHWPAKIGGVIRPLRSHKQVAGNGTHVAGWPWAMSLLAPLHGDDGILFDDWVEKTFRKAGAKPHAEPWAGVFHHPPPTGVPPWAGPMASCAGLWESEAFVASLPHLKVAIALSEHLATYLRTRLSCPVHVVKYPAAPITDGWSFDRWKEAGRPLVQAGAFLRNTRCIDQVDWPRRLKLLGGRGHERGWDENCEALWRERGDRAEFAGVERRDKLPPNTYRDRLNSSVMLMEGFAASASTLVGECVANGTPICLNHLPSLVEYVGHDYPLLFHSPTEVGTMLADDGRVLAASEHLRGLDRGWLEPDEFRRRTVAAASVS